MTRPCCKSLARVLREEGWRVNSFASAEAFLTRPDPRSRGCIVLDVTMPGLDGLELQRRLRRPASRCRSSSSADTATFP